MKLICPQQIQNPEEKTAPVHCQKLEDNNLKFHIPTKGTWCKRFCHFSYPIYMYLVNLKDMKSLSILVNVAKS